jgi:tetratricopeptide (TPR) repeat protein
MMCLAELLMAAVAAAAPKKVERGASPQLNAVEQAAHKLMAVELRRGRQLAERGRHADAVTAMQSAQRAVPNEPRVLSELCWELRVTGALPEAERICRSAVQLAKEPLLRGASLYNLGRVLEQKGDKSGAIASYRESLLRRQNSVVRERLLALDPKADSGIFRPEPLDGPFASIVNWCKQGGRECHLSNDASVTAQLAVAQPPWQEARVFTMGSDPEECVLAVRSSAGWFLGQPTYCRDGTFRHDAKATLEAIDVLPSPGTELLFELKGTDSRRDYDETVGRSYCCLDAEFSELVVCAVGPAQIPHCTPAVNLNPAFDAPRGTSDAGLTARYGGGELILERSDGRPLDDKKHRLAPALRAIGGRHRILFP